MTSTARRSLAVRIVVGVLWALSFVTGLVVAWNAAIWTGFAPGLAHVSPTHEYVPSVTPPDPGPWTGTALAVAAIVLLAGPSQWRVGRLNIAQALGALWMGLWTALFAAIMAGAPFFMPDHSPCVRQDCWPANVQETLAASPLFIACLAMIVVACFAPRLGWFARALIPSLGYLALRITQILIWPPIVVPYLAGT